MNSSTFCKVQDTELIGLFLAHQYAISNSHLVTTPHGTSEFKKNWTWFDSL